MICGAVDIGSNTLRFIVADVVSGKINNILYEQRHIIRLAEGIKNSNRISMAAFERLLCALLSVKESVADFDNIGIRYVATSALREAENGKEIVDAIFEKLKIKIEVISSEEEAEYMFKGVASVIDIEDKVSLIFDIGGGSTEYIISDKGSIVFNKSFDLGVVKLSDEYDFTGKISEEMKVRLFDRVNSVILSLPLRKIDCAIATAGTATTLAAIDMKLVDYDYRKVNNYRLKYERIKEIFDILCNLDIKGREKIEGLEKGRADLIIAGAAIVIKSMEIFSIDELIISDFGLREGLVVSYCK
ncbi:MAG: exopolyphosphatase / guanosine-5-triphosphate,3-diphosphate pyrophosphatase [Deferribacteres bacterium]|nr:Ppx/GppA phosphatase [Deferribacteraceae bacterium]MDK2792813.1 exopolyphosphatase / guanosine-5-triphosphate,3-diphosphate pyrophosphatase [Deferribacteres bacterium]